MNEPFLKVGDWVVLTDCDGGVVEGTVVHVYPPEEGPEYRILTKDGYDHIAPKEIRSVDRLVPAPVQRTKQPRHQSQPIRSVTAFEANSGWARN